MKAFGIYTVLAIVIVSAIALPAPQEDEQPDGATEEDMESLRHLKWPADILKEVKEAVEAEEAAAKAEEEALGAVEIAKEEAEEAEVAADDAANNIADKKKAKKAADEAAEAAEAAQKAFKETQEAVKLAADARKETKVVEEVVNNMDADYKKDNGVSKKAELLAAVAKDTGSLAEHLTLLELAKKQQHSEDRGQGGFNFHPGNWRPSTSETAKYGQKIEYASNAVNENVNHLINSTIISPNPIQREFSILNTLNPSIYRSRKRRNTNANSNKIKTERSYDEGPLPIFILLDPIIIQPRQCPKAITNILKGNKTKVKKEKNSRQISETINKGSTQKPVISSSEARNDEKIADDDNTMENKKVEVEVKKQDQNVETKGDEIQVVRINKKNRKRKRKSKNRNKEGVNRTLNLDDSTNTIANNASNNIDNKTINSNKHNDTQSNKSSYVNPEGANINQCTDEEQMEDNIEDQIKLLPGILESLDISNNGNVVKNQPNQTGSKTENIKVKIQSDPYMQNKPEASLDINNFDKIRGSRLLKEGSKENHTEVKISEVSESLQSLQINIKDNVGDTQVDKEEFEKGNRKEARSKGYKIKALPESLLIEDPNDSTNITEVKTEEKFKETHNENAITEISETLGSVQINNDVNVRHHQADKEELKTENEKEARSKEDKIKALSQSPRIQDNSNSSNIIEVQTKEETKDNNKEVRPKEYKIKELLETPEKESLDIYNDEVDKNLTKTDVSKEEGSSELLLPLDRNSNSKIHNLEVIVETPERVNINNGHKLSLNEQNVVEDDKIKNNEVFKTTLKSLDVNNNVKVMFKDLFKALDQSEAVINWKSGNPGQAWMLQPVFNPVDNYIFNHFN